MSLGKRVYSFSNVAKRSVVPLMSSVKEEKKDDVQKLLNLRFEENWRQNEELKFFDEILSRPCNNICDQDIICDCVDEEPVLGKLL